MRLGVVSSRLFVRVDVLLCIYYMRSSSVACLVVQVSSDAGP